MQQQESRMTLPLNDKAFFTMFIPIAMATFFSAPVAVFHSFDLINPFFHHIHDYSSKIMLTMNNKWINTNNNYTYPINIKVQDFPQEIPLLFQMDPYPSNGHKKIQLDHERYGKLTRGMSHTIQEEQKSVYLGYIQIFENRTHLGYPEGELLQVLQIEQSTLHKSPLLNTKKTRRFRLKSIRKDTESGVLYGTVEWI
jgi:hypothetical protein